MTRYGEILSQLKLFLQLAERRKIRYFDVPSGPVFHLEHSNYREVDLELMALFVASIEKAFRVKLWAASGGYGCYKVTYTVVANRREDAEKVARYLKTSKKIETLSKNSQLSSVSLEELVEKSARVVSSTDLIGAQVSDASLVQGAISVVEEELEISHIEGATNLERYNEIENKIKDAPSSRSGAYSKLGEFIGAVFAGFLKSSGGN